MGLSVSSQAQYLYNLSKFTASSTYQDNYIDSSAVSSENYNVSNITNALDSLEKSDSESFDSIGNVNTYAKNSYTLSQLNNYNTLTSSSDSGEIRLLNGEAGANDIYNLMDYSNSLLISEAESLSGTSSSSDYGSCLSDSGNIIDKLV